MPRKMEVKWNLAGWAGFVERPRVDRYSSKRPRKSLILCQLVLADSVVPLGSRQGLTRPDATFVALSTVTALTAETKFAPHTLGVSRARGPSPRRCAVYVYVFGLVSFGCGDQISIFRPIRRQ